MSPMREDLRYVCPHEGCDFTLVEWLLDEGTAGTVAAHCQDVHNCDTHHPDAWEYLSPPFRRRVEQATQAPGELR